MGRILCAIRGGEASVRTQDAAIALAKERGDELRYVYVVNTGFLDKTARAFRRNVVTDELEGMGRFLLDLAEERAHKEGIKPLLMVRFGDVREELIAAACEQHVNTVVLGRPTDAGSIFDEEEIKELAAEIEAQTAAKAYVC